MTVFQIVLMIIAILVILGGLYYAYRAFTASEQEEMDHIAYDKNGIPIIPRHERDLIDDPDFDDTVAGETVITPNRSRLKAVVEDEYDINYTDNNYLNNQPVDDSKSYSHNDDNESHYVDDHSVYAEQDYANNGLVTDADALYDIDMDTKTGDNNNDADLFSSLASATENLMPAVDMVEEPAFDDNSPVLDQHLLAEADQDQNSPLNHAEENINITLVPKNKFDVINGAVVLALVEQYGLKYGAMNMFHRYENKDGTGILWFSMMGMTVHGVAPFDLNNLTATEFNGLVLFLSLPHPKAVQGFDSMMSVAGLIARDLDTQILDENNRPLTREHKQTLRQFVQDYQ